MYFQLLHNIKQTHVNHLVDRAFRQNVELGSDVGAASCVATLTSAWAICGQQPVSGVPARWRGGGEGRRASCYHTRGHTPLLSAGLQHELLLLRIPATLSEKRDFRVAEFPRF